LYYEASSFVGSAEFAGKVAWSARRSLLPAKGTFVVDVNSTLMMTDPVGYLDMGQAVLQVETSSAQILLLISASNKNHSLVNQADFTQKIESFLPVGPRRP